MSRERDTGRYTYRGFDQLCTCGHRLGDHTAERVAGEQPCLVDGCDCQCFRPSGRRRCPCGRPLPVSGRSEVCAYCRRQWRYHRAELAHAARSAFARAYKAATGSPLPEAPNPHPRAADAPSGLQRGVAGIPAVDPQKENQ